MEIDVVAGNAVYAGAASRSAFAERVATVSKRHRNDASLPAVRVDVPPVQPRVQKVFRAPLDAVDTVEYGGGPTGGGHPARWVGRRVRQTPHPNRRSVCYGR